MINTTVAAWPGLIEIVRRAIEIYHTIAYKTRKLQQHAINTGRRAQNEILRRNTYLPITPPLHRDNTSRGRYRDCHAIE